MSEVLTWKLQREVLDTVHRDYLTLTSDALARFLAELTRQSRARTTTLRDKLDSLSDEGFMRFLLAPEVTYRLLWPAASPLRQRAEFLSRAIDAERARQGESQSFAEATWTPLGDMCFYPDGSVYRAPRVTGLMPLDFGSPHALAVDLGGPGNRPGEARAPFKSDEISRILGHLERARDGIAATAPSILEFVARFNIVFISQKDPADPVHFTSGSTGQYVGRSFVTNPHGPDVAEIQLAEALVHEGIHGLLYMQERRKPWVTTQDLLEPTPRIRSPWSGNMLAVRPYMQACFVWYGLLHFWCAALDTGVFSPRCVRERILKALGGFGRGPLLTPLQPHQNHVSADLLEAIPVLQENVLAVWNVERGGR